MFTMIVKDVPWEPQKFVRTAHYVSENMKVYNVLEMFKQHRVHEALVLDEYGVLIGVVTLQDIMDSLVGTVADGPGKDKSIVQRDDGSYILDGQLPLYDFVIYFNLDAHIANGPYNTIGGLVLSLSGSIPAEGQRFQWEGFEFEVVDMDAMRIDKILAKKISTSEHSNGTADQT